MPTQRKYKFYYFDLRGRGELSRLLFVYAGVPFEDVRISKQDWPKLKAAVPMGQLPVLEIDGRMLCQSTAIARFISREYALAGSDNFEMAKADMIVQDVFDMWRHMTPVYQAKLNGEDKKCEDNWRLFHDDHLKGFLSRYDHLFASTKSRWLIGDSVTWADIALAEYLSVCEDCYDPSLLSGYPNLKNIVHTVFSLPRVKEYVEKREKTVL